MYLEVSIEYWNRETHTHHWRGEGGEEGRAEEDEERGGRVKSGGRQTQGVYIMYCIIESVDSISRDKRDAPLTQYITNAEYLALGKLSRILNTTIVYYG